MLNYRQFESGEYHDPITKFIVGLPSGEVIDITYDIFTKLKSENMIKYNKKLDAFAYMDGNYHRILKFTMDNDKVDQIKQALEKLNIKKYKINTDYTVDVNDNVDISQMYLSRIPVKFRKIEGDFDCSYNSLTNLINAPKEVYGFFDCSLNTIYTLVGGPEIVKGGYYCSDNKLSDLEGFPKKVYVVFDAERNELTTLKGSPEVLTCQEFSVAQNNLKDLKDGPKRGFNFDCSHNNITTLQNGVKDLEGLFNCNYNKIVSLMGKPNCAKITYTGNDIKIIN